MPREAVAALARKAGLLQLCCDVLNGKLSVTGKVGRFSQVATPATWREMGRLSDRGRLSDNFR